MDYFLTKHALERAKERKITIKQIEQCLNHPTKILYDNNDKMLYKKIYYLENKQRLLLIVAVESFTGLKIITVIDTSKIKKYL